MVGFEPAALLPGQVHSQSALYSDPRTCGMACILTIYLASSYFNLSKVKAPRIESKLTRIFP